MASEAPIPRGTALAGYMERCKMRPSVHKSGWLDAFGEFAKSLNPVQVLAEV